MKNLIVGVSLVLITAEIGTQVSQGSVLSGIIQCYFGVFCKWSVSQEQQEHIHIAQMPRELMGWEEPQGWEQDKGQVADFEDWTP